MVMEYTHGKMVADMKVTTTKTKNTALAYTFTLTVANTAENGSMDYNMEQGASWMRKVNLNVRASGQMAN